MMRMPYPLLSSYVDLGGLSAFPGYSAGSLKRDVALAGVMYQHRIEDFLGFTSFMLVSAKVGVMDMFDPYAAASYPSGIWFSSPTEVDAGLSIGMGLQTPLGNIIVRLGASVLGHVSLAVEIL
jgi:NTE family protein